MKLHFKRLIVLVFSLLAGSILLSSGIAVKAAGGILDPTFNAGYDFIVYKVVVQADGKIVVGGNDGIRRFNADGSPDATFNAITEGWITQALAVQSDGKIIVSYEKDVAGTPHTDIARLNPDGSLDNTFNTGGAGLAGFPQSVANALAIQADGKILIGGHFNFYNGISRNNVARLNRDGSLDTSFNPGTGINLGGLYALAVQADGKILIGGGFTNYNGAACNSIARVNADGSFDNTFNLDKGTDGVVDTIGIQSDGRIIIGGSFNTVGGAPHKFIARLNSNGSLDDSFNPGKALEAYINFFGIESIAVQSDDKIIAVGHFFTETNPLPSRNGIARLNSDGSIDTSFDPGTGADGVLYTVALQKDGKIIIGGAFGHYNGIPRHSLARLLSDSLGGFSFSAANYTVEEYQQSVTITVYRLGDLSQAASVDYATSDTAGLTPCNVVTGIASQRCDYQITVGTLRFAPREATKTIYISIIDDAYIENSETFNITLSNPVGAPLDSTLSSATITILDNDTAGTSNPVDGNAFFIRQLYLDFLNREPDPAGFAGWLNTLNNCGGSVALPCDRVEVASDFARSEEFQTRGYFIYRVYRASLGRIPRYSEFIPDMAKVSGFLTPQELEAAKTAFIRAFITRPEFLARYGSLSDSDYVNALMATALVTLPNKQALIDDLQAGRKSRADVLRAVIESDQVSARYVNEAFIVMQYFGFLRRDPDAAYQSWINIFNQTDNYRLITTGFVNSAEYRQRFGQ
jgi:uncharacterized delta-60 repeat protein